MELQELNRWWADKKVDERLVPSTRRELFAEARKALERRQTQVVVGLRRVGKSTLLFQLIDDLIRTGVNPLHILYCNFDVPEFQSKNAEEILKEYSRITDIDHRKERVFLILDEVQKSRDWIASIKLIYDHLPNIKIVVSGSASLNILAESKRSLAGRAIYHELKPLSFREFLGLKGMKVEGNYMMHKDTLEREFDKFLLRPFPEIVDEGDREFIKKYISSAVIDPIVLKDIPKEFKDVDILLIESLVNVFMRNPGQYLQLDELARDMRRAKSTLYKAIFYLEFSFLIRRVLNFRPSVRAASRKLSRVYPYHPSLTVPFDFSMEKYAENLVLFELDTKYYWREKEKEVDFLKDNLPIEVKFKSRIDRADLAWMKYFIKKYEDKLAVSKAYVITKDVEGRRDSIDLLPLWRFCYKGL